MVICSFFQQGRCHKGLACRFEHVPSSAHDTTTTTPFNAGAKSFDLTKTGVGTAQKSTPCVFFRRGTCGSGALCRFSHEKQPESPVVQDTRSLFICRFFLRNACTKGATCPFSHTPSSTGGVTDDRTLGHEIPVAGLPILDSTSGLTHGISVSNSTRNIGGANVTFDEGAIVSSISLPSDYSIISMTNIPGHKTVNDLCRILKTYGFPDVSRTSIALHSKSPMSPQSAQIKIADPTFAKKFLQATGPSFDIDHSKVSVNIVQLGGDSAAGSNRLHLTGVTCTWFQPSKIAYLQYTSNAEANALVGQMKRRTVQLDGRRLEFTKQEFPGIVAVSNISKGTKEEALRQKLPRNSLPRKMSFGVVPYIYTAERLEQRVRESLEECGTLLEWKALPQSDGSKIKATAKFVDIEAARKAVSKLNDTKLDPLSKDKLRVQHLVSIKLSVSQKVLQAVRPQLELLATEARESNFVTVKAYDNLFKPYTQIRVSGQNKDSVARAKSSVETLLSGHIFEVNPSRTCRHYFFQEASTPFLTNLMKTHTMHIVQDRRKLALRLYGSRSHLQAVEKALHEKVAFLNSQSKHIVLDPTTLRIALRGGFRKLVETFGKEALKMDISSNPKTIIVNGSERLLTEVNEKLQSFHTTESLHAATSTLTLSPEAPDEQLCPVCLTPPEDSFTTKCRHTYCAECLSSQCTTTNTFPLICLGDSAKCTQPLSLTDLETVLSPTDYTTVLQNSFTSFIRSHTSDFQYCSTPDCDHCYRSSPQDHPNVFTCDGCLTSVCTSCNQGAHDGVSCEAVKAAHDGTDEFARWKRENDVRGCPICGVPIEKNEGCNHMECGWCKTHICWFCMKTFETGGETYGHMQRSHQDGR
ncbi:hypothetical protein P280DRAFT_415088 [Massarina eburnea CBS 473.64]|uniref:RING-type E3 ubiquitin transferase n=1 Tax=Massarina eburnea CBS 473.64 TaxID=1395130 RepID=A0A6A6SEB4_9PLEO|nr:hypothetical protein P280DRAFT_415088 [Massarina eburnea CBS 473.64]